MALDLGVLILSLILASVILALVWALRLARTSSPKEASPVKNVIKANNAKNPKSTGAKTLKKKPTVPTKESKADFTHSWLLTTLKGHTGPVLDMDFSADGKYLVSCCEDRSLMFWTLKLDSLDSTLRELNMKDIRTFRAHVEYDHATRVCWSPDNKAILIIKSIGNIVEVYKVGKKPDGSGLGNVQLAMTFPKAKDSDLVYVRVASNGRFVLTCTDKSEVDVLDLRGNIYHSFTTKHMSTYCVKISPCGRFIATSGFTPDVKVWEVVFSKAGEFEKVSRAFELTGHNSGIWSFDFSPDSSRMVTVSKDGTWRLYNTQIEYQKGQMPYLLLTEKWTSNDKNPAHIALSPDGRTVAIGSGSSLFLHSALSGNLEEHIEGIHSVPITGVRFDSSSRFILTTGDRFIRVFHNVPGYRATLLDLGQKLSKANNATLRERIADQMKKAQTILDMFK